MAYEVRDFGILPIQGSGIGLHLSPNDAYVWSSCYHSHDLLPRLVPENSQNECRYVVITFAFAGTYCYW